VIRAYLLAVSIGVGAAGAVPAPKVSGPRTTTSDHPVYRFSAAGAIGFRCAFDSTALHRCGARYSEGLAVGAHVLRVRAVARGGRLSRIVSVRIVVRAPRTPPALRAGRPILVAPQPGGPAVAAGSIWVPGTQDGTIARIDPTTGAVTATIAAVPATTAGLTCEPVVACAYLNTALGSGTDVWVSCDSCGQLARIDAATGRVVARIAVSPRPGGLAVGGGFVWAFHTLDAAVSRIDPSTGAVSTFAVPGVEGAGIAFSRGSVWLLSSARPASVLRLDPQTLAVQARIPLNPSGLQHPLEEAWGLVGDDSRLWAANPNYNTVTEIDPARNAVKRRVRGISASSMDQPFTIALAGRDVWVATRSGVVRIDERTGAISGTIELPHAGSGFIGVAYGFGAAWVTHYDRATLTEIRPVRRRAS
jgi:streptogramin lyase